MDGLTLLALKKIKHNPQLFNDPTFWRNYAIRSLQWVLITLDDDTEEYGIITEFIQLLPDKLAAQAQGEFDFDNEENPEQYPATKEINANIS